MTQNTEKRTPRGLRNNNPLNIRITKKQLSCGGGWQGMSAVQQDPYFCQFVSMKWGWRAAFVLLTKTYYHIRRLYTIRQIISHWAPPQDHNDTEAYISRVAGAMQWDADEPLGIPSVVPSRWMQLAVAMAIVENGTAALDYMAMLEGWRLACIEPVTART